MGAMVGVKAAFIEALGQTATCESVVMNWHRAPKGHQLQKFTAIVCKPNGDRIEVVGKYPADMNPEDCARKMAASLMKTEKMEGVTLRKVNT